MIYFDASAMVKLVVEERESTVLREWIAEFRDVPRISSSLIRVEVVRAVRDHGHDAVRRAQEFLAGLRQMPMTFDLLDVAGALSAPLRSLDAIHLASAMRIRSGLKAFVAYDKRLCAAAEEVGLPTVSPGTS